MTTEREEIINESLQFIKKNKGFKIQDEGMSYTSPRISSEFMDCSMPMTFDHYSYCSLGCTYCVPAGTKILMSTGRQKVIERINQGEGIISFNEMTQQYEQSVVTETMSRKTQVVVVISVENQKLSLTPEHPVFIKDEGWVEAKYLEEDDEVMLW